MGGLIQDQDYLLFTAPEKVQVASRQLPEMGKEDLLVKTSLSAVSAGTETMIYRGLFPEDENRDSGISALQGDFKYPFQYGYSAVGVVAAAGGPENAAWIGQRVFSFQPHASAFLAKPEDLIPLPDDLNDDDAVFLPNMETAVNLTMDGAPLLDEQVAVIGLGVVGLLTASLLTQFPVKSLTGIDLIPFRRNLAAEILHITAMTPENALSARPEQGFDLIYELSGNPQGLNLAIELAGFESRVVVGSWYGKKAGNFNLGGKFHRNRIQLLSSQVSTIASMLGGRWTKKRRFATALQQLGRINPSRLITHRYDLEQAPEAYQKLASDSGGMLQVVFKY